MPSTNTATRFGAVSKTLHWLTALGILALIPLGVIASDLPYDTAQELARKAQLFSIHKTLGIGVFLLAIIRIFWTLSQPRPAPLHPDRRLETFAAETVHWLLYGSLVIVPLTGWIHHAASAGFAPILWPFGQELPFVADNVQLSELFGTLHALFEKVLVVALLLHIAGALKHHVIDRDDTLRRMLPGNTEAGTPGHAGRHMLAALAAVVIWGVALGIGAALGSFSHATETEAPALQDVASGWEVQDGTLALTIRQFGQEVSGSFTDWTAAITFEDSPDPGTKGNVEVVVAIGSLTLGSVTQQAKGPDFFDVETFPTARFVAPIQRAADGFVADGTLTLRGADVPVVLPFLLTLDGDQAQMQGRVTLDRRAFGIGDTMSDPAQLGFEVDVDISLTATRNQTADDQ